MLNMLFRTPAAERTKAIAVAKAVVSLEETEGWQQFTQLAEKLIFSMTPDISAFTPDMATQIASQMAFVSGVKRCIGLMDQQKNILESLKDN